MLGPSSDVKLTSNTISFVNLLYMNIHASHSQLSNPPGSDINVTPKPDSTTIIALFLKANIIFGRFQLPAVPYLLANQLRAVKTRYLLVQILATHHCGRRCNRMEGGRRMSLLEVNLTPNHRGPA